MRWQQKILAQPKTIKSEPPLYINQYIRSLSIAEIPTADHLPGFAFPPAARITPTRYRLYCGAGTKAKTHIQALQKHLNVGFGYQLIRQQIGKLEFARRAGGQVVRKICVDVSALRRSVSFYSSLANWNLPHRQNVSFR